MNKKISFLTLGCKLNYAETSTYERGFLKEGLETVSWNSGEADIYLVNTCSVTEHSDKKCRNIIRKLHRQNPEAAIVVTGCYAQLKREEVAGLDGVIMVFGAKEKGNVVKDVMGWINGNEAAACLPEDSIEAAAIARNEAEENGDRTIGTAQSMAGSGTMHIEAAENVGSMFASYSTGERTRAFLKVQDGCDFKCHYCTVPYARGESRNIPIAQVIKQANAIAAAGIKEIVITGVNTGDFGKTTGENFLDLLKELDKVEGIERYRISSIEPNLLTEEIVDWIASGTKFQPHFHIPLQSGCDTILEAMGRRYLTADFRHKIEYIRERMERPSEPEVFFGIDVIVGFPGETDELFEETYNFLKDVIKPAFIHIFPYSRRTGTPAASMKNQVQDSVKTERVARLESLCNTLHEAFIRRHKGMAEKVLYESTDKHGMMSGYTGNYIRIERPYDASLSGQICDIII